MIPISILMRIHERPKALTRALQSIMDQDHKNVKIIASSDSPNIESLKVVHSFLEKGMDIDVYKIKPLGFPKCNLYINGLATKVKPGCWVHVFDDDSVFCHNSALSHVVEVVEKHNPKVIIVPSRILGDPPRIIPNPDRGEQRPELSDFGTPNMFFSYEKLKYMIWTERYPGDYDGLIGVYDNSTKEEIYWLQEILVEGPQNRGSAENE